ncbi:MAG: hypothetical protein KIT67_27700 [Alphaproteobacteria bacterium]|nr:hypothetical protein [Alphaproteobacteria bacterium]
MSQGANKPARRRLHALLRIDCNERPCYGLGFMVPRSTTVASERARLEKQLALTDLLIALAQESATGQRALAEGSGLEGEALAQALTSLAVIEASEASRRSERARLLALLSALPAETVTR